jgi:hypothetical protein
MADHHVKQLRKLMPFTGVTFSYLDVKKIAKRLDADEDCLGATVVSPLGSAGQTKGAGVICATTRRLIFSSGLLPPFALQEPVQPHQFDRLGTDWRPRCRQGCHHGQQRGSRVGYQVLDVGGAQRVVDAVRRQLYAPQQQLAGQQSDSRWPVSLREARIP